MRTLPLLFVAPVLLIAGCSGKTSPGTVGEGPADGGGDDTSYVDAGDASKGTGPDANVSDASGPDASTPPAHHTGPLTKVDLLFMIDNSASMGDKQALLRTAVPDLLDRLVNPSCLDPNGVVIGPSKNGACASGKPEFPAITDLHVGIVDSSLGGRGGDQCSPSATNPLNASLNAHNDDQGHLVARGGADEHPIADAPLSFLVFSPGGDAQTLISDFEDEVSGVHEFGCGFEAQLESWYRFLVQPDPYGSIAPPDSTNRVKLQGVDATVLQQRHDFLRPDSLVGVIVVTDENDSTVDPMALGGQGWVFENVNFPGSSTGGGAAMGTSACAASPDDPSCTSCAFCRNGAPASICNDPACTGPTKGFYGVQDDSLNERFFHMKQRFGVDPQFPIDRYVTALTSRAVPDRNGEHPVDSHGNPSVNYVGAADCTNPLFAASLPTDPNADLCNLPVGGRARDQVLYAVIGGVPSQLLPAGPHLAASDWTKILGNDPLHYDFTGADPHMLESMTPRAGLPGPTASNDADPIVGRDWATNGADLQYACVFDLPASKDCTLTQFKYACDCTDGTGASPLCNAATKTLQTRGKAYPTIRELAVARALGDQAVVGSICPVHPIAQGTNDSLYGYRPAVKAIGDRMASILGATP